METYQDGFYVKMNENYSRMVGGKSVRRKRHCDWHE